MSGAGSDETAESAWRSEVERSLRGKPFDGLIRKDEDAIPLLPLYTASSRAAGPTTLRSGPVRSERSWLIGQAYSRPGVDAAAEEIRHDVPGGIEAFLVVVDRAARLGLEPTDPRARNLVGKGGIAATSLADVTKLLAEIPLDRGYVVLDAGANGGPLAALVAAHCDARKLPRSLVAFSAAIDPLGALAADGRLPRSMCDVLREARWTKQAFPRGKPLLASGVPYHEAGATPALELGAIVATVVDYVREGFAIDDVMLAVAAEAIIPLAICKVRALRLLLAKVERAFELPASRAFVLGVTSHRHLTKRDAETNIVRGSVETFALAVGGADAIVTRAYDRPIGGLDARARRIAKNTQLILRDEARVGHVADPARGAFAIEALTHSLAEAGWNAMRAIEADGGMSHSLEGGAIQARVARAQEARQAEVSRRKRVLVGVTDFAPKDHAMKTEWPERDAEREAELARHALDVQAGPAPMPIEAFDDLVRWASNGASIAVMSSALGHGDPSDRASRLDRVRDAERFEALRAETDRLTEGGRRPVALIVRAGTADDSRARAEFSSRLFETAGFDVVGQHLDELVATGAHMAADVAVLASSDAVYAALGEDALRRLRATFPGSFIVLAGRRGGLADTLASVAPSADVFLGADVVTFLAEILQALRSAREGRREESVQ